MTLCYVLIEKDFQRGSKIKSNNICINFNVMKNNNLRPDAETGTTTANDKTYEMYILKSDLRMISKSTKTKAEKERMKNIFEPIFMDNAMKYFETGLPCCFGDINIDGKDFGVFGLIVWSDDKIVGVEAFVGGMDLDCEIEKLWYDFVHNRFRDMLENYNGVRYYYPANNTDEAMEFASRMVYDEAA